MTDHANDLIDALVAHPGLYVGPQADPTDPSGSPVSVARITVTALPGGAGVSMDYEVISASNGLVHAEHAVLARATSGLVLVTAHSHATTITVLHETEPGYFPSTEATSPFPMAIRLEVPEPGQLVYSWSHAMPGEELIVRDVGSLTLVSG